jgi:CheY-like chemotaxis protein
VANAKPDIILLDLLMPKLDGFEFLSILRARPDGSEIAIVVLTAKDLPSRSDRTALRALCQ